MKTMSCPLFLGDVLSLYGKCLIIAASTFLTSSDKTKNNVQIQCTTRKCTCRLIPCIQYAYHARKKSWNSTER